MERKDLGNGLRNLVIFKNLRQEPLIESLAGILCAQSKEEAAGRASCLAAALYPIGIHLSRAVLDLVLKDDNFYVRTKALGKKTESVVENWLFHELHILSSASAWSSTDFQEASDIEVAIPSWNAEPLDFHAAYARHLENVALQGYGIFARHKAFSMTNQGRLSPILHPDSLTLAQLYGYEAEKEKIIKNTQALLSGLPANNILLYGDAGTGKSSTVKAVANEYFEKGLRLIQIEKGLLHTIPALLDELADNPLKFILFIDDLSFASNDKDFTALKTVLEGSVAARSGNVVVYATSNRRHLVNETFGARRGDEIHLNDTLEEVSSLSARFGIVITFGKPDKDLYSTLVIQLAMHYGLCLPEHQLITEAEAYAIRSGGRSPRVARQYVEYKIAMADE